MSVPVAGDGVRPIDGAYIVGLRPGADARGIAAALQIQPGYTYDTALNGFAARLTPGQLTALQQFEEVEAITQDVWMDNPIDATQTPTPAWGIDRIDQRKLPLSNQFTYTYTGTNVQVYVIDTGIDITHPEFGGRAQWAHNAIDLNSADCNGHGTHVAGTIGSRSYGVAKNVQLRSVKVFNCAGAGTTSSVIGGIEWVAKNRVKPAVANTSWQWVWDANLSTAVRGLMAQGVFVAASAGNTGNDSCDQLPRGQEPVMVVGNTDSTDTRSPSSSYGPCVKIYAPGTAIRSTLPLGQSGIKSGTSMSAPHVAGVVALFKDRYADNSQVNINNWLINCSTKGVVKGSLFSTPNRLLYSCAL